MDPNTTLEDIRAIIADMRRSHTDTELVELGDELSWMITDLDEWLGRGGYLPNSWNHTQ